MKTRWTQPALADLIEAQDFIAKDNPRAAMQIAERAWSAAKWLQQNPEAGRNGNVPGTREWVITNTPYLIVYRLHNDTVEILRVWHAKQNWKT